MILGFDFIWVNGGKNSSSHVSSGSSLIAFEATSEQSLGCSPPRDMIESRWVHMVGISDGNLVVCGGRGSPGSIKHCEKYDHGQESWTQGSETLEEPKGFFRSVQLDSNRIWMGRKFSNN